MEPFRQVLKWRVGYAAPKAYLFLYEDLMAYGYTFAILGMSTVPHS